MKLTNIAGILCFALVISACNNVDFKKTKTGMPYKLFPSKTGKEIDTGNFVKVHMIGKVRDSVVFNTYKEMAQYLPVTATGNSYDFSEILPSLKEGDSILTVQLIDSFIARDPRSVPPQFKKGDKLETTIKIVNVFKSEQEAQKDIESERNTAMARMEKEKEAAFEKDTSIQNQLKRDIAILRDYLTKNNIPAQQTGKGTHVQILNQGTGMQAEAGKYVSVKYKGQTFAGKIFDTNMDASKGHTDPLIFQVGTPGMIKGFDEGIRSLKEGGKARIFIPSVLAYGAQSPSPDIKAFENLIFDIEVLKVSDQPIQQPQMAPPVNIDSVRR